MDVKSLLTKIGDIAYELQGICSLLQMIYQGNVDACKNELMYSAFHHLDRIIKELSEIENASYHLPQPAWKDNQSADHRE